MSDKQTIVAYVILSFIDESLLSMYVTNHLEEEWVLHESLQILPNPSNCLYVQTMVKVN